MLESAQELEQKPLPELKDFLDAQDIKILIGILSGTLPNSGGKHSHIKRFINEYKEEDQDEIAPTFIAMMRQHAR